MLLVFVGSLLFWMFRSEGLPQTVRIATAEVPGVYHLVGEQIEKSLGDRLDRIIEIVTTQGSVDNFRQLNAGKVDLAIVQGGTVPIQDVSVVTPLYPESLIVIVRKSRDIETIPDLADRNVALGWEGSGNRISAIKVLDHFGIRDHEIGKNRLHFKRLADDPSLDAALAIAGVGHRDLVEILASNEYRLHPVESARAIDMVHPFLRYSEIPQGLFAERPAVPAETIPTVSTIAYLVVRNEAPEQLVRAALAAVHEESLRLTIPTLIPRHEVLKWVSTRMHPVAQQYFNPSDDIGVMANVMESLAATKELIFAFGAGLYLLWHRWRRLKEREIQEAINRQKEHLDSFLEKTLRIEAAQMTTSDVPQLRKYLDQVIGIKLEALREFTEEELRGDQAFSIFLTQCANLISTIQMRIIARSPLRAVAAEELTDTPAGPPLELS
jgi:TRAP transporter TAXI family solute receptor